MLFGFDSKLVPQCTYPSCTGPIECPAFDSSLINALVIDSVAPKPPSCYAGVDAEAHAILCCQLTGQDGVREPFAGCAVLVSVHRVGFFWGVGVSVLGFCCVDW